MQREKPGQTLQATALVHETFLRLCCPTDPKWEGRRHFFGAAAEAMRRILVEQARKRARLKRGGDVTVEPMDADQLAIEAPGVDVLSIDEALQKLEASDPRAREIVNLRCFVGLTIPETAAALGVSESTVEREWRFLRTFLQRALEDREDR